MNKYIYSWNIKRHIIYCEHTTYVMKSCITIEVKMSINQSKLKIMPYKTKETKPREFNRTMETNK
jgi:hypothetical protein